MKSDSVQEQIQALILYGDARYVVELSLDLRCMKDDFVVTEDFEGDVHSNALNLLFLGFVIHRITDNLSYNLIERVFCRDVFFSDFEDDVSNANSKSM